MPVDSHIKKMFGDDITTKFLQTKVLLVGAGGIGCELLKDLIMMNIGEIHVLDLDTIDLSNLNRQFLFRHKDIKQSKSKTAIKAVESFTYKSKLYSYHGSILDNKMFPISFFKQFDIIYNALDNLEARFYVNRMCLFLNIPLYESGTTGLRGQVQPIYPHLSECFNCIPKETPKTFPVCTIRSTPSKPVHCITWAKQFLFAQLFCGDEEAGEENVNPEEFTNEEEAKASANEVNELADLKKLIIDSKREESGYAETIFKKIFIDDIERLLRIEDLWKSRERPTFQAIENYEAIFKGIDPKLVEKREYLQNCSQQNDINDILETYVISLYRLSDRLRNGEVLEFDKDDEDTLRFVMSTSNLRSLIFHIPVKNEFDLKQIAGNIIPAVATMNAIMAGFSALSSVKYFTESNNETRMRKSRMVYDTSSTDKVVNSSKLVSANPNCPACSVTKGIVEMDFTSTTLEELRTELIKKYGYADDVEIMTLDSKLLYDFDLEENLPKKVGHFIKDESILLINDSDEKLDIIELYAVHKKGTGIVLPDLEIPLKKKNGGDEEGDEENDETDGAEIAFGGSIIVLDDDTVDSGNTVEEVEEVEEVEVSDEPPAKRQRVE